MRADCSLLLLFTTTQLSMDIKSEVLPKSCWLPWGQAWVQPCTVEDLTPRISPVTSCLLKVGYGFGVTCVSLSLKWEYTEISRNKNYQAPETYPLACPPAISLSPLFQMTAPLPLLKAVLIDFAIALLKNQSVQQLCTILPYTNFVGRSPCPSSRMFPKTCSASINALQVTLRKKMPWEIRNAALL